MSLMTFETPEYGREDSQSALDFAYWMLSYSSESYGRESVFTAHEGTEESGAGMLQAVAFALQQVNIQMPTDDYDAFRAKCLPLKTTFKKAMRTRGALLFRGKSLVMSVGDSKRVMEYYGDEYVTRFLINAERNDDFWLCARIPEMIYL